MNGDEHRDLRERQAENGRIAEELKAVKVEQDRMQHVSHQNMEQMKKEQAS